MLKCRIILPALRISVQSSNRWLFQTDGSVGNGIDSCFSELQSISHTLYHTATMSGDENTRKALNESCQKLDNIVLRLHQFSQQHHPSTNLQNPQNNKSSSGRTPMQEIEMKPFGINDGDDDYVVTQKDVDEINLEMEELFGFPPTTTSGQSPQR